MVCRDRHRPGLQNVATFRLSLAFNEDAQFDLMFYRSILQPERDQLAIIDLVDACIRWDCTQVSPSREEDDLLS
eukprot:2705599-Karenia_brevis.AAC.1